MVIHGVLLAKTGRLFQCVEEEVGNIFPNLDGEPRIRFRAIKYITSSTWSGLFSLLFSYIYLLVVVQDNYYNVTLI